MLASTGRLLIAFLSLTSIASTVLAQGNTFNPYGNSGYADYREFGNPMYSNNPALPGQAILNSRPVVSRPRANSFQQYSDELDGIGSESSAVQRSSSFSNLPYYQAYQRMNLGYDRVYKPNNTKEDREFYERQKKREQDYANAIKESDPAKRARLLRQIELDPLNRPSSTTRSATTKSGSGSKPNAPGSSTTARSSAPLDRRSQAPSPLSSEPSRRSPASSSAGRAPSPLRTRSTPTPAPITGTRPEVSRMRPTPAPDPLAIPTPLPR